MRGQVLNLEGEWRPCYYFWKPDQQDGYMSNWYRAEFFITDANTGNQLWFDCSEQYFMWQKANLFHDEEIAKQIMEAMTPYNYKALGQRVRNFNQEEWDENKIQIMIDANYYKFTQNPDLKSELLQTGDAILVEASPYDRVWGTGLSTQTVKGIYQDMLQWPGQNLLGKVLMNVREIIKSEDI